VRVVGVLLLLLLSGGNLVVLVISLTTDAQQGELVSHGSSQLASNADKSHRVQLAFLSSSN